MDLQSEHVKFEKMLVDCYESKGLKAFLQVSEEMLRLYDADNGDKKQHVNGALCEVVLKILTLDYLKRKKYVGSVYHSVVLSDPEKPKSQFRTELDFVLFTPCFVLTAECKSFSGNLRIHDKCTVSSERVTADVYRQSLLHGEVLKKHMNRFLTPGIRTKVAPCGLFCFLYSRGIMNDERAASLKRSFPVLSAKTLYSYYDSIFTAFRQSVYNFDSGCRFFLKSQNSKTLHQAHRDYLGY